MPFTDSIDLLTGTAPAELSVGVTTTTTSSKFDVSQRDQIVVQFVCTNHAAGNGVFSLDGSNDGVNWTTGLACQDLTSTNATTYVTSKTLSSNTSAMVRPTQGFRFIRCLCTITTDGTYNAFMESSS